MESTVFEVKLRVAEPLDEEFVMGRDHDCRSHSVQFFEKIEQAYGDLIIDIACRLVGQEKSRAADNGPGNGNPLLLSARECRRLGFEMIGEADPP